MKSPKKVDMNYYDIDQAIIEYAKKHYDIEVENFHIKCGVLGVIGTELTEKAPEPVTDRKAELNYLVINGVCHGRGSYVAMGARNSKMALDCIGKSHSPKTTVTEFFKSLDHNIVSESDYKAVMEFEGTTQPDNCYDPSKEIPISLTTLGYWKALALQGKAATLKDQIYLNIVVIENK